MTPLHGVIPPLITPLANEDQLDLPHLEKLLHYLLGSGIHGLFLLGTTGEGPSLSHRLKRDVVEQVCRWVNGRIPVLVNVSDTSMVETVALANHASRCGATALVVSSPYYFPLEQEHLWKYVQHLIQRLPLPLYLYNMPSHVKVSMGMEFLQRAIQEPAILGIKDSSGDRSYFQSLIKLGEQRPEWSIMVGPEELFADVIKWGGHGGVLGGANLYPSLLVKLFHALRAKDLANQSLLVDRLQWLHQHVLQLIPEANGWLVGLKTAMSLVGLCEERFAEPIHPMSAEQKKRLQEHLTELRQLSEF